MKENKIKIYCDKNKEKSAEYVIIEIFERQKMISKKFFER